MDAPTVLRNLALQTTEFLVGPAICALLIVGFIISLLIAIWVYRDAESRGMSGVLWLLVVLVAGIIGLIIYLVVRGDHPVRPPGYMPPGYPGYYPPAPPPGVWPPAPGSPPPPAAGTTAGAGVTCKSCGTTNPVGGKFCRACGSTL